MDYKSTVLGLETATEPPKLLAWVPIITLLKPERAHLQSKCHHLKQAVPNGTTNRTKQGNFLGEFFLRKNRKQSELTKNVCNEIFIYREFNGLNFQLRLSLAKCWGVADDRLMKAK